MKKILLFDLAGIDFPGGCEKYFANLAKHLSVKHQVTTVVSMEYRWFMDIVYYLLSRRKINSLPTVQRDIGGTKIFNIRFISILPFSKEQRKVRDILLSQDRIYAKNEFQELAYLYFILGRKEYKERVIVGVHTPIFIPETTKGLWKFIHNLEYRSILYKKFLRNSYIIHVNNIDYKHLIAVEYDISKKIIVHIPNPIDWDTSFINKNLRKSFIFIWLGRFTKQKGIDRLQNVLELIKNELWFSNIRIHIGGNGEEVLEVVNLAKKYSNIKYLGYVSQTSTEYQRADAALFTAYYDTFAHAVLEPLSFGVPVIGYDIPGPRDMIVNGKNGYLVNNDQELADAIKKIYFKKQTNGDQYLSFRKKIYAAAQKKYSNTVIYPQIEEILTR